MSALSFSSYDNTEHRHHGFAASGLTSSYVVSDTLQCSLVQVFTAASLPSFFSSMSWRMTSSRELYVPSHSVNFRSAT
jgi:hypothetical protein